MNFTGLKDTDKLILNQLNDRDLLTTCSINKYLFSLCNEDFFRNRLYKTYPDSTKYKPDNMSWKKYYLNVIYWVNKILEDQEFQYKTGDPKKYFDLFYNETTIDEQLKHTAENNYTDLLDHLITKHYNENYYKWAIVGGAAKGNRRELFNKYLNKNNINYALYGATEGNHLDLVKEFIDRGATDLNKALRTASFKGYKDIVEYLFEKGASEYDEALYNAVRGGHKKLIDYLLLTNPNQENYYHHGLSGASWAGNIELFDFFIDKLAGTPVTKNFFRNLIRNAKDGLSENPNNQEKLIDRLTEIRKNIFG